MTTYKKTANIRWADLDPNYHLRHSAYYDLAAQFRTEFLQVHGIGMDLFRKHKVNPVLLKEEGVFRREIRYGQNIYMSLALKSLSEDLMKYEIEVAFTREDDTLCATVTILGGWLDFETRKLAPPPQQVKDILDLMPKHADFKYV